MRKSTRFLGMTACNLTLFALMALHAHYGQQSTQAARQARALLARELHLTDLCLFTEARYTRHPAMADLHAPFQDHPLALEHFPSGSLVSPPYFSARAYVHSP